MYTSGLCCSTYLNRNVLCRWTSLCNLHTVSPPVPSWGIKDPRMRCDCKTTTNSITSEFGIICIFIFVDLSDAAFPMKPDLNQYLQLQAIERSLEIIHCSFLQSLTSNFLHYVWKVLLACCDLIPETVWASMSTGSEQIRDACIFLKSFKSSESPSLVTSASSNQAVSQAAEGGCQPWIVILTGNRFNHRGKNNARLTLYCSGQKMNVWRRKKLLLLTTSFTFIKFFKN